MEQLRIFDYSQYPPRLSRICIPRCFMYFQRPVRSELNVLAYAYPVKTSLIILQQIFKSRLSRYDAPLRKSFVSQTLLNHFSVYPKLLGDHPHGKPCRFDSLNALLFSDHGALPKLEWMMARFIYEGCLLNVGHFSRPLLAHLLTTVEKSPHMHARLASGC